MLRFKGGNYRRPLINAYYDFRPLNLPDSWGAGITGGINLERSANGHTELAAWSKDIGLDSAGPGCDFNIDWYFTPFKPLATARAFHAIASTMRGRAPRWRTWPPSTGKGRTSSRSTTTASAIRISTIPSTTTRCRT